METIAIIIQTYALLIAMVALLGCVVLLMFRYKIFRRAK